MDNEQAKFLLCACQSSGLDDKQPDVVEALAVARKDPGLDAWLAEERASDSALAKKMRELEPPPELRSRLLIGVRASRKPPLWRRFRMPLGMAALFMVGLGIATLIRPPGYMVDESAPTLTAWQKSCVGIFAHPFFSLDYFDESYAPLEDYLVKNGARVVAGTLPFGDGVTSALGCSVLEWREAPVSLACFNSEEGELVHLFAMPARHLESVDALETTHRTQVGSFATATWSQDDLVVMVASQMHQPELDALLDRSGPVITAWLEQARLTVTNT